MIVDRAMYFVKDSYGFTLNFSPVLGIESVGLPWIDGDFAHANMSAVMKIRLVCFICFLCGLMSPLSGTLLSDKTLPLQRR